jgi:hypothetical protein
VRDRLTIIAAYQDAGTCRGAAAVCGTTPKTVKRAIQELTPQGSARHDCALEAAVSWAP